MEHKEVCSRVNGKQRVKLRNGSIKFKSNSNQLAVPFKIYIILNLFQKGFEVIKEEVMLPIPKNINDTFLVVLITKLRVLMIDLAGRLFFTEEKMQSLNLLR